jgi:V/A-type H+-transporting ATPase subunit D
MTGPAIRSRLHALHADLRAARLGRDLLDDKREAILRTLSDRGRRRQIALTEVEQAWACAGRALGDACIELGPPAVDSATLAQPVTVSVAWRPGSVVGVATPRLRAAIGAFEPHYGVAATAASLDRAGLAFTALIPELVRLSEEEEAVRNLRSALRKTVRRLQALEQRVIPQLEREARAVATALEEEERDDAVRARRWHAQRSGAHL